MPLLLNREKEFHQLIKELDLYIRMSVGQFVQLNVRLICQTTLSAEKYR